MANFPVTHKVTWFLLKNGVREEQGVTHHHNAKLAWGFVNRMGAKFEKQGCEVNYREDGLLAHVMGGSPVEYVVAAI
jgi:hypothetical protein